jgi:hypothetical protein
MGLRTLRDIPGVWYHDLGDGWAFALNAHDEIVISEPEGGMRVDVPARSVAFWWNGWLAGLCDVTGGTIAAGAAANENALIASLKRERAKAEARR